MLKVLTKKVSRKPRTPSFLILFVTSRCNARCKHCFYWKKLNSNPDELTLSEIEHLSYSFNDLYSLAISGGEPSLREDLHLICKIFYKNSHVKRINFPTNGLLPFKIKELSEKILKNCPNSHLTLILSIDGPERIHDEFRGVKGNFAKTLKTYELLNELKSHYPNLSIQVSSTISSQTYQTLEELAKFVKNNMPGVDKHAFQLVRGEPRDISVRLPPLKEVIKLYEKLKTYKDSEKGFLHRIKMIYKNRIEDYSFNLQIRTLKEGKQVLPCVAGESIGVITETGDVRLCELLPAVGNVRDSNFERVWNSKAAMKQRDLIQSGNCFCTHECFLYPSIIFNPTFSLSNFTEYIILSVKNIRKI